MTKSRDGNGQFTKGNPGRPKGAKGKKTETLEAVGLDTWRSIQEFITTEGAEKWIEEIRQLDGKEYIQAYTTMLEYFKPKLARTEVQAEVKAETKDATYKPPPMNVIVQGFPKSMREDYPEEYKEYERFKAYCKKNKLDIDSELN